MSECVNVENLVSELSTVLHPSPMAFLVEEVMACGGVLVNQSKD